MGTQTSGARYWLRGFDLDLFKVSFLSVEMFAVLKGDLVVAGQAVIFLCECSVQSTRVFPWFFPKIWILFAIPVTIQG